MLCTLDYHWAAQSKNVMENYHFAGLIDKIIIKFDENNVHKELH